MEINKQQEQSIIKSFNSNSKDGMIAFINVSELPQNAMSEKSLIEGQAFMIGTKEDNEESIINSLCKLGLIDEFDDNMEKRIIDLAMDLLTHNRELNLQ